MLVILHKYIKKYLFRYPCVRQQCGWPMKRNLIINNSESKSHVWKKVVGRKGRQENHIMCSLLRLCVSSLRLCFIEFFLPFVSLFYCFLTIELI